MRQQRKIGNGRAVVPVGRPLAQAKQIASMAPQQATVRAKDATVTRGYLEDSRNEDSKQVLSASQSLYPVGSQYTEGTYVYSISRLSTSAQAYVQSYDKYRIKLVEVYATLTARSKNGSVDRNAPVNLWYYEDTDADSAVTTSWIRVRDRKNLAMVTLTALRPTQKLISFEPTPCFSASSTGSLSPNNMVPRKGIWLDSLAINQQYSSLRHFSACPQVDSSGQSYEYTIHFTTKYVVELKQPI